ncbi:2-oxoglutarate and Fe(II)-dependent oxygenase superfamily protein [Quillaja saponaria]|uniref:2-oxoglutarate and Fe(II)-dependent oxygenase superfamily protein n=1 Tax=Quillaja saponaria TaxID=32244 RepID=A0AAD7Q8R3_QUISA|nr:2-oxoglutarate and Fe(II)-dependent oxygenase superfamily protein [Quillaja saponaria]
MSPAIAMTTDQTKGGDHHDDQSLYQKGVKHLCENGLDRVPDKYILPAADRPNITKQDLNIVEDNLKLPIIDFAQLLGPNRSQVLKSLANACEHYGFFQVINHGIAEDIISNMIDAGTRFFELPFEDRAKYMSNNMQAPVRYGTSYNQNKDKVFCWRDFLKLLCHPLPEFLPLWPSSPVDFQNLAATYSKETKYMFLMLMEAIIESLGIVTTATTNDQNKTEEEDILKQFEDGSQVMVVNFYPPCPEPDLTIGLPPHSDYGFLTLLLQDEVEGLQIQFQGQWVTVEPIANKFVINVGDHLEIFSNGKYKSVLHRVLVNSVKSRISVASLHSLPFNCMVRPSPNLIGEENPKRYKDTDFGCFLNYVSSCEPKRKDFLESRKLTSKIMEKLDVHST